MSWQATSAVTKHSKHSGSELLCLIMLANYADSTGSSIFPSIPTLAKDCRMSERGVRYVIAKLIESGELVPIGRHQNNVKIYRINLPEMQALQSLQGLRRSPEQALQNRTQALQSDVLSPAIAVAAKRSDQSKKEESPTGLTLNTPIRNPEQSPNASPANDPLDELVPVPDNGFVSRRNINGATRIGNNVWFLDKTPWINPPGFTMDIKPTTELRAAPPECLALGRQP